MGGGTKMALKKFVINLERREDRRDHFIENNNLSVEFITAVDGELEDLSMYPTREGWVDPFLNRPILPTEVACFLSHRKAWEKCVELDEPIIVIEDDAIINETWDEEYYEKVIDSWDFLYLQRNENEPEKVYKIDDRLERPWYPYNTTAYVIRPKGARKLLKTDILSGIIPVDEYLPEMIQNHSFNALALSQDACNQASVDILPSDIREASTVHVITIGTEENKLTKLRNSAHVQGIKYLNIGEKVQWNGTDMTGPGGGMKINLLKAHIEYEELPDTDIILFTDAYDVFYADTLHTIKERYKGFNHKVVFSAESVCWPDESIAEQFPPTNTPYRYLNSGTFIGEVGELKKILSHSNITDQEDDQLFYQEAYLEGLYDIVLDTEGYIFQTHEPGIQVTNGQLNNGICCPCIYHGNGGAEAKKHFENLYQKLYPNQSSLFIANLGEYELLENDMLLVDFMTISQCEDLINMANANGNWKSLDYDKFPAQEIRLKQLELWEMLEFHWQKYIAPIAEKHWKPLLMYGLRDAFILKYSPETQTKLSLHHDASYVTGSVKLNEGYEGGELSFPRQNLSNKDIPVGKLLLFPGAVTHPHECLELKSGTKYSLTIWSQRFPNDTI